VAKVLRLPWTVNEYVPAVVGVPLIIVVPLAGLMVKPGGSDPWMMDQNAVAEVLRDKVCE
jgi:hypothetical protein